MRLLILAFCAPALLALLAPVPAEMAELFVSRLERGLALLLALGAGFLYWRGTFRPFEKPLAWPWLFLPALTLFLHSLIYLYSARHALFLADQDISNVSSAIANTAAGRGLLPSAHVQTGISGSFLGHHFAPALLLFVPFYSVFPGAGHIMYPVLLSVTLSAAVVIWTLVLRQKASTPVQWLGFLPLLVSVALFRLSQSFHFEVLALVFSGMAMLAYYRGNPRLFIVGILLWSLVKEDTAVHAALLCAYLAWTGKRKMALPGLLVACAAAVAGRIVQTSLGGAEGPDWTSYLRQGWPALSERSFLSVRIGALLLILASAGFLPLLRIRYALFVLAPVAALHASSFHPWHAAYYGHYSYSILPLLFAGAAEAGDRIASLKWKTPILLLACACAMYANASDKKTPAAPLPRDAQFDDALAAAESLKKFPLVCVHAQSHLSPLVPVNRTVLPLFAPSGNPHRNGSGLDQCAGRIYLFDERPARGAMESTDEIRKLRLAVQSMPGCLSESFGSISVLILQPEKSH
jgi:uncharacterized membrane protein